MTPADLHTLLIETFGTSVILGLNTETRDPSIGIAPEAIADVCHFLANDPQTEFDALNNLCAVDWLETDPKKKTPVEPHLEVLYHLFSYTHKHACVLKVRLPRWKDNEPGCLPQMPTVSDIWAIAAWHEREAFDLMGIEFVDHPDLRRILCPEDWVGHPLRKDYEFPLEYHGIRAK